MIEKNSIEWKLLVRQLEISKQRSNTDYLCLDCWRVFSQSKVRIHKEEMPGHFPRILGSKYFATEKKFIALAKAMYKYRKEGSSSHFENPYEEYKCFKYSQKKEDESINEQI